MDAIDALGELVKGAARGGKYYRRVATGNPKRPWKYYYSKKAYDAEHGDSAHRNGEEEKRAREEKPKPKKLPVRTAKAMLAVEKYGGLKDRASQKTNYKLVDQGLLKPEAYGSYSMTEKGKKAWEMHQLAENIEREMWGKVPLEYWPKEKLEERERRNRPPMHGKKKEHPVSESQRRWAFAAEERGELPKGTGRKWSRRVKGEDLPEETGKSMDEVRDIDPNLLSKGMHSFYDHDGKMKSINPDWLADYADSFFEEAYEHERTERMHADPNLVPASDDPVGHMARMVYNEFIAMCAHNKNLAAAKKKLNITPEYVEARLRSLGLFHIDTENHEATRQAAVAGYHPSAMALSEDGFAAAATERNEMLRRLGGLRKSEDTVTLPAGPNPFEALHKSHESAARARAAVYGESHLPHTINESCPFHGRDPHKAGLDIAGVQGAVCTCG